MDINEKANARTIIVKEQIDKFDNKASILIAVLSILFAISLSTIEVFGKEELTECTYKLLLGFSILYFTSFVLEMLFLILVIYPRGKKKDLKDSTSYYMDVSRMSTETLKEQLKKDDELSSIQQLIMNSKICTRKHKYFIHAIWTLIPLFVSIVSLFFIAVI